MEQEYSYLLQIREIKNSFVKMNILDDYLDQNIRVLENKLEEYGVLVEQKNNSWNVINCTVSITDQTSMEELKNKYCDSQIHKINLFVYTNTELDQYGRAYSEFNQNDSEYTIVYQNIGWTVFSICSPAHLNKVEYVESVKLQWLPEHFSKMVEVHKMCDFYPAVQKYIEYKLPYRMNLIHNCVINENYTTEYNHIVNIPGDKNEQKILSCRHCSVLVNVAPENKCITFE